MTQSDGNHYASRGFTLLETLLVLTVVGIMAMIPITLVTRKSGNVVLGQFCEQLRYDLYYAQQLAISTGVMVEVFFHKDKNYYMIRDTRGIQGTKMCYYDADITEDFATMGEKVYFDHRGNNNSFGTMYFTKGDKKIKLTFQLGKGRFYFEEQ